MGFVSGFFHGSRKWTDATSSNVLGRLAMLCIAGIANQAHAAINPPPQSMETGFISALRDEVPVHLPANARGVLFLSGKAIENIGAQDGHNNVLIDHVPPALNAQSFSIEEMGKASKFKPLIKILDIGMPSVARYHLVKNKITLACLRGDQQSCKAAGILPEDLAGEKIRNLIAKNKVQDVTDLVAKAVGLFRVEPAEGFQTGKTYSIRYRTADPSWAYPGQTTVVIDPLAVPTAHFFSLDLLGEPKQQFSTQPGCFGSICGEIRTNATLKFGIPKEYFPYRNLLQIFIRQKYLSETEQPGTTTGNEWNPYEFSESISHRGADGTFRFETDSTRHPASYVKGFAGFLEVEDRLHETQIVEVQLHPSEVQERDTFRILQKAIASKDMQNIRDRVCRIAYDKVGPAKDRKSMQALLDLVRTVTASSDAETRSCGYGAMASIAEQLPSVDATRYASVAQVWTFALADADSLTRTGAAAELEMLMSRIQQGSKSERPRTGDWRLSIFLPSVPALTKALSDNDAAFRHAAARTLGAMGEGAKPAVPALLNALGDSARSNSAIPQALAGIAPDDPGVRAALIAAMSNADARIASNAAYVFPSVQGARAETIKILSKAAQAGNGGAIERLGEIGSDAHSALPILLKQAGDPFNEVIYLKALKAAVAVSDGEPEVIALISSTMLRKPPADSTDARSIAINALGTLGVKGRPGLPALESLIKQRLSNNEKWEAGSAIRRLEFPKEQETRLLDRLAAAEVLED